jgi:CheY-like chemotaxis protein
MSRILLVDDEPDYRNHLSLCLEAKGHEVRSASSGREAIAIGLRYHPDVLIADWMLRNHVHGLHVCEVLRLAQPRLRAIVITGFPSSDLRSEARRRHVVDFLEKPFDPEQLQASLDAPSGADEDAEAGLAAAVVDLDDADRIIHANAEARRMFDETQAGAEAGSLDQLFDHAARGRLCVSARRWVEVSPRCRDMSIWHARTRYYPDSSGRTLLLLRARDRSLRGHPIVQMLLDADEPAAARWPVAGHVLVVDDEEIVRRAVVNQLDRAGCICHAAENAQTALRLIERDDEISVAVLDYSMPGQTLGRLIERLRAIRAGLVLVGNSGLDRRREFAEFGVHRFLSKPWRAADLINLVIGRIAHCADCGLAMALRYPHPGERGQTWACRGCGCRYEALLDRESSPEAVANVIRADGAAHDAV